MNLWIYPRLVDSTSKHAKTSDSGKFGAHDELYIHAKKGTTAWNLPHSQYWDYGVKHHAIRRFHGISPGFPVHYQDLEY